MKSPRNVLERFREDRRVRRDFERLISAEDFQVLDNEWVGERERKPPLWRRGWRWWIPRVAIMLVLLLVAVTVTFVWAPLPRVPPAPTQTAFVYDREGELLARLRPGEDRVVLSLEKIPKTVQDAIVASEDERFYRHSGVDFWAIIRAAWNDVRGRRFQGGSTITQQLVKEYYVGSERSLWRKVREAALAIRFERQFSKDEILEQYLNIIYLGEGAYGVEAAAQTYFRRSIHDVTLSQAALIASIAPAPGSFSPRRDPEGAVNRRNYVLERMAANGFITAEQAARAKEAPLGLKKPREPVYKAPQFVQFVRKYVLKTYDDPETDEDEGADVLNRGGLQIRTTLDLELQNAAEKALAETLYLPEDPAAAVVALDVRTGEIRAMAQIRGKELNLAAQGRRQAGSAFKPFVLAAALADGVSPYRSYYSPGTVTIGEGPEPWRVSNYDGSSYGTISLVTGTVNSVNTLYAQLIDDIGPPKVARMARRLGISSPMDPEDPTLTLGTPSVSPLEMTTAFATLAAGGVRRDPVAVREIRDSAGEVLEELEARRGRRVLKEDVAGQVTAILEGVVRGGTGTAAQLSGVEVAGKTGTTDDHSDAWFCGYTSELATCVWVGHRDARKPMESVHGIRVTGGSYPARIWRAFMSQAPTPAQGLEAPPISGTYEFGSGDSGGSYGGEAPAPGAPPTEAPPQDEIPPSPPPPDDPDDDDDGICLIFCD